MFQFLAGLSLALDSQGYYLHWLWWYQQHWDCGSCFHKSFDGQEYYCSHLWLGLSETCFFEHVAEVRDSPNSLRIEYKIIPSSWQWEWIESKLHGYITVQYKIIRRNIDIIRTVNSSPAIMPLAALYFGVHFFQGHISLKNWTISPLLARIKALSRTRVLLLS
jgi:hypothetical protein